MQQQQQLSSKEVSYITDCMEMAQKEQTKFNQSASKVQNQQLSNTLKNIAQMHQSHLELLKQHIPGSTTTH